MTAKIISGREVAENILQDLKNVLTFSRKNITPKLVVVLVGDMKKRRLVMSRKRKICCKSGYRF